MKYETAIEFIEPLAKNVGLELTYKLTEKSINEVGFSDLLTILIGEDRVGAISLDIAISIFENYIKEMLGQLNCKT